MATIGELKAFVESEGENWNDFVQANVTQLTYMVLGGDSDDLLNQVQAYFPSIDFAGLQSIAQEVNESSSQTPVFMVWAEKATALVDASYEWSFGNGANHVVASGLVIPIDCELISLGTQSADSSAQVIQVVKNGVDESYQVEATAGKGNIEFSSPLSFSKGDTLNFKTVEANGANSDNTVSAVLRLV